ncbi:MAG: IS21 family transposase [Thermodesulfobacteriota bacterium]|jgi:transposase|nr:IS21 family transposase [Thermodesulfobacteriota bacterium]
MAHKEYGVTDILDLLRRAKAKDSQRRMARATSMDRKTVRNYLALACKHGFDETTAHEQLPEIAAAVFREVHGGQNKSSAPGACAPLLPHRELLCGWLEKDGLTLTKAHIKLGRMGVDVTYSTLYRYAREALGFGGPKVTVRMAETEPGEVAQVDFGRMGLVFDPETGKNRVLHALVVTLVFSRHQYVYLTHRQDLDALIAGIEEAWEFFGGVSRRLIVDNLKAAVIKADRYEPVFNRTFQEYSQHRGFIIDPAVVRHPEGKATVENQVKYVRENFFKGESFTDREHAQRQAERWCRTTAGVRLHGTTRKRPLLVFEKQEQPALLPLSAERFDVPVWAVCKVHPDHHVRFKNALYSLPTRYVGKQVEVKGTRSLVRIYYQNQLVKTHPKAAPGKRSTDFDDYPKEKSAYALRDVAFYIRKATERGEKQGAFMAELLSGDVPWTYIRQAQQLLRLADKYGSSRVEAACSRALAFGLMNVRRVEGIIRQSLEQSSAPTMPSASTQKVTRLAPARFVRDASYFNHTNKEDDHGNNR